MTERTIEGNWDDVVLRNELRGHRVRVTVLDKSAPRGPRPAQSAEQWARELQAWADAHPHTSHFVDDSRDSIYGGTVDEPR